MNKKHNKYPLAVHIFLCKGEELLLSLRKNTGYEDGKYSVVAGHVENGESLIAAGIREVKEEVGIDVTPFHFRIVGSMHRKSDDERIDYFAVVETWSGEIKNCEENKCGGLNWFHINNLPYNIIPYIKFAIVKTFFEKKRMWYEEFGWNTYYELEEIRKHKTLVNRGLIKEHGDLNDVYNFIFDSVYSIDCKFKHNNKTELWLNKLKSSVLSGKLLISTPILQNFNLKSNCVLSACTIITLPINKNGEIIYRELEKKLEVELKAGMGVGIDLSILSEPDKAVNMIDEILYNIDNSLIINKRRPVAVILTLKSSHPRIIEFIKSRINKNEQTTRLNISILIDGDILKKDLEDSIIEAINISGEPGILFLDRFEKGNDTPQWQYNSTAPCAEIAMSYNDACHFSHLNISAFLYYEDNQYKFNKNEFIDSIYTVVRFLDDIIEYSISHCPKGKYELVKEKRRIGVGIAGFATALLKMGVAYDSKEGIDFANEIAQILAVHTKMASIELAKERGPFPAFNISKYKDGNWLNEKFKLLGDKRDSLIHNILVYGIRNATTLAFPPTGTSSQIVGVSPSFEPYLTFALKHEEHMYVPSTICDYIYMQYSSKEAGLLLAQILRNEVDIEKYKEFVSATKVDAGIQLTYTKIFQDIADGSASKTINLPEDATTDDIRNCLRRAQIMGLKGIAIYKRTGPNLNIRNLCNKIEI